MLEQGLAEKFIEQLSAYTSYNINIMDERGVIIASTDAARVGEFHDVAYHIIHSQEDMVITSSESDYPTVRPGINMAILVDGRRAGVLGLTGDPKELLQLAKITKLSIETMLKYELEREANRRRVSEKEQFVHLLINNTPIDPSELRLHARRLSYSEQFIRIPVLCRAEDIAPEQVLQYIKSTRSHSKEDISLVLDSSHLLLFKCLPNTSRLMTDYKFLLAEYLSPTLQWLLEGGRHCRFYFGSIQHNFTQYSFAFRHCRWLEDNIEPQGSSVFFYDYSDQYLRSIIPMHELSRMYNTIADTLSAEEKQSFIELMGALIHCNYHLSAAAALLFLHKNTLLYRLNKLRASLNMNPLDSASDRFFMEALYTYLIKEQ